VAAVPIASQTRIKKKKGSFQGKVLSDGDSPSLEVSTGLIARGTDSVVLIHPLTSIHRIYTA
jgi:hypothetical protein